MPDSVLRFDRLDKLPAGELGLTMTRLSLLLRQPHRLPAQACQPLRNKVQVRLLERSGQNRRHRIFSAGGWNRGVSERDSVGGLQPAWQWLAPSTSPLQRVFHPTRPPAKTRAYQHNLFAEYHARHTGRSKQRRGMQCRAWHTTPDVDHSCDKMSPTHGHCGDGHGDGDGHGNGRWSWWRRWSRQREWQTITEMAAAWG